MDIKRCQNVARVERLLKDRIGLNRSLEISATEGDDGTNAYAQEKKRLHRNLDRYMRLLVNAKREDFSDDEIKLMKEELEELANERLSELEFWEMRDADRNDPDFIRNLVRCDFDRGQGARPKGRHKWKLGEKSKLN